MKVTLIGDSLRQQYGPKVAEILKDEFEVWQPHENCRFAKYTLRGLFDWRNDMAGSDIVHWNNGHWDLCNLFGDGPFSTEEEYIQNMLRILDILQTRHKVIIFATTSPVLKDGYNTNAAVQRYNEIIVPLLQERGVIINDLHALIKSDLKRYMSADTIHLSEEGIKICAIQVAECIREAAKRATESNIATTNTDEVEKSGAPVLLEN